MTKCVYLFLLYKNSLHYSLYAIRSVSGSSHKIRLASFCLFLFLQLVPRSDEEIERAKEEEIHLHCSLKDMNLKSTHPVYLSFPTTDIK